MKRGTPRLTKTKRLARALKIPVPYAVGLLECLWHVTVEEAPRGDIGRLTDAELAEEIGWPGKPLPLVTALVETGWLDRDDTHRLVVHDWHDHADQALHRKLERLGADFCTRNPVTSQRLDTDETPASPRLASREAGQGSGVGSGSQGRERERGEGSADGVAGSCASVAQTGGSPVAPPADRSPPDTVPDALATWARAEGCRNPQRAWEHCRDWHAGKGRRPKDWPATFRNWVRKAHGGAGPPCVCAERAEVQCRRCRSYGHEVSTCDKRLGEGVSAGPVLVVGGRP